MPVNNFVHLGPLSDNIRAQLVFALVAQVFHSGIKRRTLTAEIVEENVNLEVIRQNLAFVLANVFRTELHLASLDVVSILNEGRVEHQTAEGFVGETSMSKQDLYVTLQSPALSLLLRQKENYASILHFVVFSGGVREDFIDVETIALVHVKEGNAAASRNVGHLVELDASESFNCW